MYNCPMTYLSNKHINETIYFAINTQNSSGNAVDADSTPTYNVYEQGVVSPIASGSLTNIASPASVKGFYVSSITPTSGGGYNEGLQYMIRTSSVVNSQTGVSLFLFKLEHDSVSDIVELIGTPTDTLAEDISNMPVNIWQAPIAVYGLTAGTFGNYVVNIKQDSDTAALYDTSISGTVATISSNLNSISGSLPTTTGITSSVWSAPIAVYGLTAGTMGNYVADIKQDSDTTQTYLGTMSSIINSIGYSGTGIVMPWNPSWDAEVQSEVADALTAYDPPTKSELDSAVDGLLKENITYEITTPNGSLATTFVI